MFRTEAEWYRARVLMRVSPGTMTSGMATRRYQAMLQTVRKGWFSNETEVFDDAGSLLATIDLSSWRENAKLEVAGKRYLARHETWDREFALEGEGGQVVAVAEKPSAWKERFSLEYEGRRYELAKESAWGSAFVLSREDAGIVGSIRQKSLFGSEMVVDLPEELPIEVQMLVFWLTMILRRRQAAATGGAASD